MYRKLRLKYLNEQFAYFKVITFLYAGFHGCLAQHELNVLIKTKMSVLRNFLNHLVAKDLAINIKFSEIPWLTLLGYLNDF